MHWRNSGGVTKSIIWNFCFFFLLDSMLLFSCHLVPFFFYPLFWGFCVWQFLSTAGFVLFVTLFLLSWAPLHPFLDLVCSEPHSPFLSCSCLPYFSFSFCLIVSYNTEKQIPFLSAFFYIVLCSCHFPFRIGALYSIHYSFWFQESQTHVRSSAKAGGNRKQSKQPVE